MHTYITILVLCVDYIMHLSLYTYVKPNTLFFVSQDHMITAAAEKSTEKRR